MDEHDVETVARSAWLNLADRAMREAWDDRASWEAAKATIDDLRATFGTAGVDAFYALERQLYRLIDNGPTMDAVEEERIAERTAPVRDVFESATLALIEAGCRYLREHPEALREPSRGTPGGQHDG